MAGDHWMGRGGLDEEAGGVDGVHQWLGRRTEGLKAN